jgi:hypothetical protein
MKRKSQGREPLAYSATQVWKQGCDPNLHLDDVNFIAPVKVRRAYCGH